MDGQGRGFFRCLASDVVMEGKRAMGHSLVGFLKENVGVPNVVSWMKFFLREMPVDVKMIGTSTVRIKFHSEKEVVKLSIMQWTM